VPFSHSTTTSSGSGSDPRVDLPVVGFSTNVWDNPADIVGHLEFLAQHFSHLEFEIAEEAQEVLFAAGAEEYERIVEGVRRTIDEQGLDLSVHAAWWGPHTDLCSDDDRELEASVALLKRGIDVAADFGVDKLTYHPGHKPKGPTRNFVDVLSRSLERVLGYADRRKVTLCLENMGADRPRYVTFTPDELQRISATTGTALTLDVIHLASLSPDRAFFLESIEGLAPYSRTVHVADMLGSKHAHLPIGEGDLGLAEVLTTLGRYGYKGAAIVEEFVRRYPPEVYLARAVEFRDAWEGRPSRPGLAPASPRHTPHQEESGKGRGRDTDG
jgi:sugar phosphate isomerase/epimerase